MAGEPTQRDVVYYDGTCALCHFSVRQMVLADPEGRHFDFAPIGGRTWQARIAEDQRTALPDSVVIQTDEGQLLTGADAVRHSAAKLGGRLAWLSPLMALTPRLLQDRAYHFIARHRKQVFGEKPTTCPTVPERLRGRFLP